MRGKLHDMLMFSGSIGVRTVSMLQYQFEQTTDSTVSLLQYHGWLFEATGKCTAIPQGGNASNPRTCATVFQCAVKQG